MCKVFILHQPGGLEAWQPKNMAKNIKKQAVRKCPIKKDMPEANRPESALSKKSRLGSAPPKYVARKCPIKKQAEKCPFNIYMRLQSASELKMSKQAKSNSPKVILPHKQHHYNLPKPKLKVNKNATNVCSTDSICIIVAPNFQAEQNGDQFKHAG